MGTGRRGDGGAASQPQQRRGRWPPAAASAPRSCCRAVPNATPPPLFLARFSPKFRPFSAIFRPFSPSWRQEARQHKRTAEKRRKTGEKRPRNSGLSGVGIPSDDAEGRGRVRLRPLPRRFKLLWRGGQLLRHSAPLTCSRGVCLFAFLCRWLTTLTGRGCSAWRRTRRRTTQP